MKTLLLALLIIPIASQAEEIVNPLEEANVNIARVTDFVNLGSNKDGVLASVAVQDEGGSTDMSPTERVFFNLYQKGENWSTDAAFPVARTFGLVKAKRVGDGQFEVTVISNYDRNGPVKTTYAIDARRAMKEMAEVSCEEFDCEASENFTSKITLTEK